MSLINRKFIHGKIFLMTVAGVCALSSCTKDMKDMNRDQKLITDKMLEQDANEGGYTLPGMQLGIVDVLTTCPSLLMHLRRAGNNSQLHPLL